MAFTFDLDNLFKVSAHLLPTGTLWVMYEPEWATGREDMLRTRDLGQTNGRNDRWTDKLITTGCLQSGTLKIEL